MANLRFAILGTGYWSRFQLGGWQELEGVECVALYNRTRSKAEAQAREFGVPMVYDDPEELLEKEDLDFLDIITNVETHSQFVHLAAAHNLPVICQKPMATTLQEAEAMVRTCQRAGVPFLVHENWRWQRPIRQVRRALDEASIGAPFRARIHYCSSYPVFDNQPFLKELEQFILTDMGTHILDVARFLFGEAESVYCQTHRIHRDIKGEDVATVMMAMVTGATVVCEISYASRTEFERFPQTYITIEGEKGAIVLDQDYAVRVTTEEGTCSKRYPPWHYAWAEPTHDLSHASIVPCNANLLQAIRGAGQAETTAEDNLKTLGLVFGAYESAASGVVVKPKL
jgi:predicted dehydrogenase